MSERVGGCCFAKARGLRHMCLNALNRCVAPFILLNSSLFYFSVSLQWLVSFFWTCNDCLCFTFYFSVFFFSVPIFFTPARNTEKVGGAALRSVPHSLWLVRSHSRTHSSILSLPSRQKKDCSFPGHTRCRKEHSSNIAQPWLQRGI